MQTKHILILAGWGASIAAILSGMTDWAEISRPQVVAGILGALCTQVLGMYAESPKGGRDA